jgi:hypothetical protein
MFSIFKNGIKNIYPEKQPIILPDLVKMIRNNPATEMINHIRRLRENKDQSYKDLKRDLAYITPNCVVKKRSLKMDSEFDSNFSCFSGYIYFDFDVENAYDFKHYFTSKYKHIVSLVSISASAGGISVLVNPNVVLTNENFNSVWDYVLNEVFTEVASSADLKTKDIGRAMFVSSDPEVFVEYENELIIKPDDLNRFEKVIPIKKGTGQCISPREKINTVSCTFLYQLLPFEEIKKVNLSTPIVLKNSVIDYQPINYLEIRFPKEIPDGHKHRYYTSYIHKLVYLNPDLDPSYIYSFILYINKYRANPSMELRSLQRLFEYVYNQTQQEGYKFKNERIKNFHLNKDCSLSKEERLSIINKFNGMVRSNQSIQKIIDAKAELIYSNEKITQKKLAQITGLGIQTVKKYYKVDEILDIKMKVDEINNEYLSNSGATISYHSGFNFPNTDFDLYH